MCGVGRVGLPVGFALYPASWSTTHLLGGKAAGHDCPEVTRPAAQQQTAHSTAGGRTETLRASSLTTVWCSARPKASSSLRRSSVLQRQEVCKGWWTLVAPFA